MDEGDVVVNGIEEENRVPGENGIKNGPTRIANNDEEDPVVHEIPVFLSKSLANNLYLFQYPVRPSTLPYEQSNMSVIESKFKPRNKQAEMTIALNTGCSNYDRSKGEQIALNVDGSHDSARKEDDEISFPTGQMDRQVLTSTKAVQDVTRYAVGILDANELHLTPLSGVLSLRPSLSYLDKSDRTAKAEGRPKLVESSQDEDDPEEEDKAMQVQRVGVRFLKGGGDAERSQKRREKSYEYQQKKAAEEPWTQTQFHHVKSDRWTEVSQKLFCKHMDDEASVPNNGGDNLANRYLNELKETKETTTQSQPASSTTTTTPIKTEPMT